LKGGSRSRSSSRRRLKWGDEGVGGVREGEGERWWAARSFLRFGWKSAGSGDVDAGGGFYARRDRLLYFFRVVGV